MREKLSATIDRAKRSIAIVKNDPELYEKCSKLYIIAVNGENETDIKVIWKKINLAQKGERFTEYSAWENMYNPTSGVADFAAQQEQFENARGLLDDMENLLSLYAEYDINQTDTFINKTLLIMAIVLILVILLVLIVILYMGKYFSKAIRISTGSLTVFKDKDFVRSRNCKNQR
jgi:hypothetical protein